MDSGLATRPIADFDQYREASRPFRLPLRLCHEPVFAQAKTKQMRVIYAEGEDERILRAAHVVVEEKLARPILVGRPSVVQSRIERFGLSITVGDHFDLVNPEDDPR